MNFSESLIYSKYIRKLSRDHFKLWKGKRNKIEIELRRVCWTCIVLHLHNDRQKYLIYRKVFYQAHFGFSWVRFPWGDFSCRSWEMLPNLETWISFGNFSNDLKARKQSAINNHNGNWNLVEYHSSGNMKWMVLSGRRGLEEKERTEVTLINSWCNLLLNAVTAQVVNENQSVEKKEAQAILMLELPTRWQFGTFTSQAVDTILSNNTSTSFPDSTKWEDPGKEDGNNSSDLFPWSLGQVMPKGGTHVLPISKWLMSLSACFFH